MSDFFVRPWNPRNEGEEGFFFQRTLDTFRDAGQHAHDTDFGSYHRGHHQVLDRLLARGAQVSVASPTGEEMLIAGFALHEPGILHYVYTQEQYRGAGVAMQLIASLSPQPKLFTHRTRSWSHLERRLPPMIYAPYLIAWPVDFEAWSRERAQRGKSVGRQELHQSRTGVRK